VDVRSSVSASMTHSTKTSFGIGVSRVQRRSCFSTSPGLTSVTSLLFQVPCATLKDSLSLLLAMDSPFDAAVNSTPPFNGPKCA
jgi:hypothetical protein